MASSVTAPCNADPGMQHLMVYDIAYHMGRHKRLVQPRMNPYQTVFRVISAEANGTQGFAVVPSPGNGDINFVVEVILIQYAHHGVKVMVVALGDEANFLWGSSFDCVALRGNILSEEGVVFSCSRVLDPMGEGVAHFLWGNQEHAMQSHLRLCAVRPVAQRHHGGLVIRNHKVNGDARARLQIGVQHALLPFLFIRRRRRWRACCLYGVIHKVCRE